MIAVSSNHTSQSASLSEERGVFMVNLVDFVVVVVVVVVVVKCRR
jgi:flavin reductase (DIM6/NTAB) family NADH-FMN oxidoreductase RutF